MSELAVVEVMFHIVATDDSWHLRIAHRHHSGLFGDCPADNYPQLTIGELADVLDCEFDSLLDRNDAVAPMVLDEAPF